MTRVGVDVEGTLITIAVPATDLAGKPGDRVTLSWGPRALRTLETE